LPHRPRLPRAKTARPLVLRLFFLFPTTCRDRFRQRKVPFFSPFRALSIRPANEPLSSPSDDLRFFFFVLWQFIPLLILARAAPHCRFQTPFFPKVMGFVLVTKQGQSKEVSPTLLDPFLSRRCLGRFNPPPPPWLPMFIAPNFYFWVFSEFFFPRRQRVSSSCQLRQVHVLCATFLCWIFPWGRRK